MSVLGWLHANEAREHAEFPMLPPYAQWIVEQAQSIGLSHNEGPTTHQEILAWVTLSGVEVSAWEVETIMLLSRAYTNALHTMSDEIATPPFMTDDSRLMHAKLAEERLFSALMSGASK